MDKSKEQPKPSKEASQPSQEPTPRKTGREFTDDKIRRTQVPPGKRYGQAK